MTMPRHERRRSFLSILGRSTGYTLGGAFLAVLALVGYYQYLGGSVLSPPPMDGLLIPFEEKASPEGADNVYLFVPNPQPGIRLPVARRNVEADIDDASEVIGVYVEGRARAYLVEGMGWPHHVVNDVLGDFPVSVTYCDQRECVRVFTADRRGAPLEMDVGGWVESFGMALRIKGVDYLQESGANVTSLTGEALPYREISHLRTTWGKWRKEHPDTDIYVGEPRPSEKE